MTSSTGCEIPRSGDPSAEGGAPPQRAPGSFARPPSWPVRTVLTTADGVALEAAYRPRRAWTESSRGADAHGGAGASAPVIVVAHGFTGALDRPALQRAVGALARHAAVVTFSFRGHGRSGGRSTVGDREVLDLAAAVQWARRLGHARVATVGFSMGGSVALRHAALHRAEAPEGRESGAPAAREAVYGQDTHTDAVVAVSAPARWFYQGTAPMRRLHWAVQRPVGRLVSRWGLRTRVHHRQWDRLPLSPTEAAPRIAPTDLLVVHGDRDAYFPLDHPRALVGAADPSCTELWLERGFGHAENAAPPELVDRIARWAVARTAPPSA